MRNIDEDDFKRRYRISGARFDWIYDSLGWKWEKDTVDRPGVHPVVKSLAALYQLTQGVNPYQAAQVFRISETVALTRLVGFC